MSADLYWQRLASLPSLSTALMGFRSITMSRQRVAQSQSFWNPNKERCILIRADAHVGLLAVSASRALPIKPLALFYSLTRIEDISPEEVQYGRMSRKTFLITLVEEEATSQTGSPRMNSQALVLISCFRQHIRPLIINHSNMSV